MTETHMISKTYYVQKDFSVSDPFDFLNDEREDIYFFTKTY